MSTPFLGQIQAFPFAFPPKGWALCNGQLLPVNQNQPLFSLLGTMYGGNGIQNFALPNLQGSFQIGQSNSYGMGATGGEATHTLLGNEIPLHTHDMVASSGAPGAATPQNNFPAAYAAKNLYASAANTTLGTGSSPNSGGMPHDNMPPYTVISFCIALNGIFPSRN